MNKNKFGKKFITLLLGLCLLIGCERIALSTIPEKKSLQKHSLLERQAKHYFWKTLHQGSYQNLPEAIRLLTAAYLENPNDPQLAALLGFAHIWVVAERQRKVPFTEDLANHIVLSKKFFSDAVILNPKDARIQGFYGDAMLVEGKVFQDKKEETSGYFTLLKAIHAWPQFNYFTAGYPMSALPSDSPFFKQGLEWQWKTLDLCAKTKVDRLNPTFEPYMKFQTKTGPDRACWNSWIAPHNFEGFFLNMGDMLVKSGDWRMGILIYKNAMLEKSYASWKYRAVLEERIKKARTNVSKFNQPSNVLLPEKEPIIMFNSMFSCVACHKN